MTTISRSQNVRGQTIVEYLAVALAIIGAILALAGPINGASARLMQNARHQLQNANGTADFLFR